MANSLLVNAYLICFVIQTLALGAVLAGHKWHPEPEPEPEPEHFPEPEPRPHPKIFTTTESFQAMENPNSIKCPPRQSGGLGSCVHECDSSNDCSDGATCCENWCGKRCIMPGTK